MQWADRTEWQAERPRRADSLDRATYEALCNEALDYYESGDAQRRWLRVHLLRRYGEKADPRKTTSSSSDLTTEEAVGETDSARMIREGRMELLTVPLVRSIVDSVAVLYSADDLERSYTLDGKPDQTTADTLQAYHEAGGLGPRMQSVDAMVGLLGAELLLCRWCAPRSTITYDQVHPHLVHVLPHPEWRLDAALAYAVAYREDEGVWCTYVRPPLPIDPDDAPTRMWTQGRLVRYKAESPWPLPQDGDKAILPDGDGPNPLVLAGGMKDGQLVWSPLVWHWARPPVDSIHPHPASDLVAANREIDLGLSWLQYLSNTQSHGQAVRKGTGPMPESFGPQSLIQIDDPAGDFHFAAPGANIAGLVDVVQRQMQVQALLRHLSPDMYSLTRPSIQTGPAKLIEQHALIEARWRRTLVADQWERARFDLERVLHNAYGLESGAAAIPRDSRLTVRWGELRVPTDRMAQVQRLMSELQLGITSRLDAAMEVYGLDRAAAERHLEDVDKVSEPAGPAEPKPPATQSTTGKPSEGGPQGPGAPTPEPMAPPSEGDRKPPAPEQPPKGDGQPPASSTREPMNGAQVLAVLDTAKASGRGELPRESAVEIVVACLGVDRKAAELIVPPDGFRPMVLVGGDSVVAPSGPDAAPPEVQR